MAEWKDQQSKVPTKTDILKAADGYVKNTDYAHPDFDSFVEGAEFVLNFSKTDRTVTKEELKKAWDWFTSWAFENAPHKVYDDLMSDREDFFKAMEPLPGSNQNEETK